MQDGTTEFYPNLSGLDRDDWLDEIAALGDEHGFFRSLGDHHAAVFIKGSDTLVVSFEDIEKTRDDTHEAAPVGFDLVSQQGWSALTIFCTHDTWFRDAPVYGFFDQLIDDGFFDHFDDILFYGSGSCGYAAAAYSVAAPGARVLSLQPQATLDPRVTEWDERYLYMRLTSFTDRYGFAPDMIDAARRAFVVYDPRETLDAMHAALFTRKNVTKLRVPSLGHTLEHTLRDINRLHDMIVAAAEGDLSELNFARMMRARRDDEGYLLRLLAYVEQRGHLHLAETLCRHAAARFKVPRFHRRLRQYARARAQAAPAE